MAVTSQPAASADAPHLAAPDENPSFIKGLFLGEIREDLVFPFPELSVEERESLAMVLDSFRSFAADHVDVAKHDHDGRFPANLDALVPEYLPAVPLDPLAANDRPLTYVPGEPRPCVYSVGSDGRDDGGEPDGLEPSPIISRSARDLIADLRRPPRYDKERDYELIVEDMSAWDPKLSNHNFTPPLTANIEHQARSVAAR